MNYSIQDVLLKTQAQAPLDEAETKKGRTMSVLSGLFAKLIQAHTGGTPLKSAESAGPIADAPPAPKPESLAPNRTSGDGLQAVAILLDAAALEASAESEGGAAPPGASIVDALAGSVVDAEGGVEESQLALLAQEAAGAAGQAKASDVTVGELASRLLQDPRSGSPNASVAGSIAGIDKGIGVGTGSVPVAGSGAVASSNAAAIAQSATNRSGDPVPDLPPTPKASAVAVERVASAIGTQPAQASNPVLGLADAPDTPPEVRGAPHARSDKAKALGRRMHALPEAVTQSVNARAKVPELHNGAQAVATAALPSEAGEAGRALAATRSIATGLHSRAEAEASRPTSPPLSTTNRTSDLNPADTARQGLGPQIQLAEREHPAHPSRAIRVPAHAAVGTKDGISLVADAIRHKPEPVVPLIDPKAVPKVEDEPSSVGGNSAKAVDVLNALSESAVRAIARAPAFEAGSPAPLAVQNAGAATMLVQAAQAVDGDVAANARLDTPPPGRPTLATVGEFAVKSVRYLIRGGQETISVRLVPESLGVIHITVKSTSNLLEVEMKSASSVVRAVLETQLSGLREVLARDGIDVTKAVVSTAVSTDAQAGAFGREGPAQTANTGQGHSSTYRGTDREPGKPGRNPARHDGSLDVLV